MIEVRYEMGWWSAYIRYSGSTYATGMFSNETADAACKRAWKFAGYDKPVLIFPRVKLSEVPYW